MPKSKYPEQIDTDVNLPQVRDKATSIRGDVTNSLKSAILAIEKTLGINPQGTQSTLVARLNVFSNSDGSLKQTAVNQTAIADRNLLMTDGGLISWSFDDVGLTWSSRINLRFPGSGGIATSVDPTTVYLPNTGDVLFVELSRTGSNPIKPAQVQNLGDDEEFTGDIAILAVRDESGFIHWRNGTVMSPDSSFRFGGAIAENVFYDSNQSFINDNNVQDAIDTLDAYAQAESRDRNLQLIGDADNISFDSVTGELSWDGDFEFNNPNHPTNAIIRDSYSSPITIENDGYSVAINLDAYQPLDYFVTPFIVPKNELMHNRNTVVLGTRGSNKFHLRNGQVIFNPTAPVTLGEVSANHVALDSSTLSLTADNVESAFSQLESADSALDSRLTTAESDILTNATLFDITAQDRALFMQGGGDFSWDSGTNQLTFTSNIRLYAPNIIGDAIIPAGSVSLTTDRSVAYVVINRSASSDYNPTVSTVGEDLLPSGSNVIWFAMRLSANKIALRNGQIIFDGDQPIEIGETDGSRVTFDNSGTALSSDNMQDALAELDGIVSGMGGGSVVGPGTIIMVDGVSCPAGSTQVAGINGAYPRAANASNLTPVGQNTHGHGTHSHGGSTFSAGSHSHSLPGHDFIDVVNMGFGGGFNFDAFFPGVNNLSNTGNTSSSGNHSHSLNVGSASVPTANHEPLHFDVLFCKID